MDPALAELMQGPADTEVEALIKLKGDDLPPGVEIVSRFGPVATCRLQRADIRRIWSDPRVVSLKAPRLLDALDEGPETPDTAEDDIRLRVSDLRRPDGLRETGAGGVLGVIDFGCDFAHPNFRNAQGGTRLLALWDQRGPSNPLSPEPYGYGRLLDRSAIDAALAEDDPYTALDQDPADADPGRNGAHGTHVMDIAAGNGSVEGSPLGLAPDADLIFVHLSTSRLSGLSDLGDSVRILEAVDFIHRTAGERPCVINTSLGRHSGSHKGDSLVEQGMDALLTAHRGRAIVQSCGNYHRSATHAGGRLGPGQSRTLTWFTDTADLTPNELEVWYEGRDRFLAEAFAPDSNEPFSAPLGESVPIVVDGEHFGRLYHRASDPAAGDHHIDLFLSPQAPAGAWRLRLTADEVVDGRYHAWIERDSGCRNCQSRFAPEDAEPATTTGTICNGFHTIAVGAYNAHREDLPLVSASSSGPTRDGRLKPDLTAPGGSVLAARSHPRELEDAPLLTRKTGTSMAAPHVAGTVLLLFEAAKRPLRIAETRRALLGSLETPDSQADEPDRNGGGRLDILSAVSVTASLQPTRQDETMNQSDFDESDTLDTADAESNSIHSEDQSEHIGIPPSPGDAEAHWASEELQKAADAEELADDMSDTYTDSTFDDEIEALVERSDRLSQAAWQSESVRPGTDDFTNHPMDVPDLAPFDTMEAQERQTPIDFLQDCAESGCDCDKCTDAAGELLRQTAAGLPHVDRAPVEAETAETAAARILDADLGLYGSAADAAWRDDFEVLGHPGEVLDTIPQRGDLVIERALGEGGLARLSVVEAVDSAGSAGIRIRRLRDRRRHPLRLRGRIGRLRLPRNTMLIRSRRFLPGHHAGDNSEAIYIFNHCLPGEGPPAALPDPSGRGLHPLVYRGRTRLRSRNPTVGDAQYLLNRFLSGLRRNTYSCRPGADIAAINRMRGTLTSDPLRIDCRFGPQTEKVTRMFQRCVFPGRPREWDGKIGPRTWTELERLRPARPVPPRPIPRPVTPPPPSVPSNVRDLLRRVQEALESITEWIPDSVKNIVCPGITAPRNMRFLSAAEQTEARTVYASSLDFSRIIITDGLGCGGRPFTVAFPVSSDWWVALNQGSVASFATRPRSDTLIHELAHAWQSQHHGSDPTAFMRNSMINQAAAAGWTQLGMEASAYAYVPGKPFSQYGAEQIAEQVEDTYNSTGRPTAAIAAHVRSVAAGAADPDNEASLTVVDGFERRSASGVVWP